MGKECPECGSGNIEERLIKELSEKLKNIKEKELKYIINYLKGEGVEYDKVDWYALGYDTDYEILKGFIFQEYGIEIPEKTQNKSQTKTQKNIYEDDMGFWKKVVKSDIKSIAVIGESSSGKTAISFRILGLYRKHTKRDIYVLKHPKPYLIEKLAYKNLHNIEDLERIKKSVIYIDEPQLVLPFYNNNGNPRLAKLLSISRHRDNTIILSTSMSQYVTRMLEGQIDMYIVKDIEYSSVKQGSRVRKIIKDNAIIDVESFRLNVDEYLFYSRKFSEFNSKHNFKKPAFFTDEYSKLFDD